MDTFYLVENLSG